MAVVSNPFRYYVDLVGHTTRNYVVDHANNLQVRIGVTAFEPSDDSAGEINNYWGGYKFDDGKTRQKWVAECVPFQIAFQSDWCEAHYRLIMKALSRPYKTIIDANTDRVNLFYKGDLEGFTDLTGYTEEELEAFGFVNIFASDTKFPVAYVSKSESVNHEEGIRFLTITFDSRYLT